VTINGDSSPVPLAGYPAVAARLERAQTALAGAEAEMREAEAVAAEIAACRARAKAAEDETITWRIKAEESERQIAVFAARVEALEAGLILVRRDSEQRIANTAAQLQGRGRSAGKQQTEERRAREAAEVHAESERQIEHEKIFGLPHL
jgi:hypothetical protein